MDRFIFVLAWFPDARWVDSSSTDGGRTVVRESIRAPDVRRPGRSSTGEGANGQINKAPWRRHRPSSLIRFRRENAGGRGEDANDSCEGQTNDRTVQMS